MKITNPQDIYIEDYNYDLPDERIAKYPLPERDSSKLLVFKSGHIKDAKFSNLSDYLPSDSMLVFNNTKVIQARLHFKKSTGASIEIFCLEPHSPNDYLLNFQQRKSCSWLCLVGNAKKWKEGNLEKTVNVRGHELVLSAHKIGAVKEASLIEFNWDNDDVSFSDILEDAGKLPIPPYLNRDAEERDLETYQTVYSKIEGSVAAPTAGLHFSERVFTSLHEKGITTDEVTLHVGAGTFRPVKADQIKDHDMHTEFISVTKDFIESLLQQESPVIAVGTTSVRTLESLYYVGQLLEKGGQDNINVTQWQAYDETVNRISRNKALENILCYLDERQESVLTTTTQIMIAPGYEFKIVDGVITNFHQPQSTLLLLVSAFVSGDNWSVIYNHALENNYRFLSYGDSSLLLKE